MIDLNTTIFVKINAWVGQKKWLDAFGRAGAEWVILAILAWYIAGLFMTYATWPEIFRSLAFLAGAWLAGWLFNLIIGLVVKEPRPYVNRPEIKILFTPLSNWKTFPSDHAMSAFLIFFLALIFHLPAAWGLLPLALWVVWGRLYAGVHYPLDILGGICVAGLMAAAVKYISLFF